METRPTETKRRIPRAAKLAVCAIAGGGVLAAGIAGFGASKPLTSAEISVRVAEAQKQIETQQIDYNAVSPPFTYGAPTTSRYDALFNQPLNCIKVSVTIDNDDRRGNSSIDSRQITVDGQPVTVTTNGKAVPFYLPARAFYADCTPEEMSKKQQMDWIDGRVDVVGFGPFNDAPNAGAAKLNPGAQAAFDQFKKAIVSRENLALTIAAAELRKVRQGTITVAPVEQVVSTRSLKSDVKEFIHGVYVWADQATYIQTPPPAPPSAPSPR